MRVSLLDEGIAIEPLSALFIASGDAQVESSKSFARNLMAKHEIPGELRVRTNRSVASRTHSGCEREDGVKFCIGCKIEEFEGPWRVRAKHPSASIAAAEAWAEAAAEAAAVMQSTRGFGSCGRVPQVQDVYIAGGHGRLHPVARQGVRHQGVPSPPRTACPG